MTKTKFNYNVIRQKVLYALETKQRFAVMTYTNDPLKYAKIFIEDFGVDNIVLTISKEGIKLEVN